MESESSRSSKNTTRHPIYAGVRRRKSGKWVSEIRDPNKRSRIWLGTFESPETAAKAHDVAMLALHGDGARLNFADSAHKLRRAESCSREDIQRASSATATALQVATDFDNASSLLPPSTFSSNVNGGEAEFVDEEAMFNLPLMMDCMAEAMLLTPPALKRGFNWTQNDFDDDDVDFTLWGKE